MGELELFNVGEPSLLVEDVGLTGVLRPSGTFVVARLDGSKMSGVDEAFEQFSDALAFHGASAGGW